MSTWNTIKVYLPIVESLVLFTLLITFSVFRERTPTTLYTVSAVYLVYLVIRLFLTLRDDQRFLLLQAINILGICALLYIYYVR